jgi:hypothetical protein
MPQAAGIVRDFIPAGDKSSDTRIAGLRRGGSTEGSIWERKSDAIPFSRRAHLHPHSRRRLSVRLHHRQWPRGQLDPPSARANCDRQKKTVARQATSPTAGVRGFHDPTQVTSVPTRRRNFETASDGRPLSQICRKVVEPASFRDRPENHPLQNFIFSTTSRSHQRLTRVPSARTSRPPSRRRRLVTSRLRRGRS